MAARDEFVAHCAELLSPLGAPRVIRMFGGHGIHVDGVFAAIVTGETLHPKTDAQTGRRFKAAGCAEFTHASEGQQRRPSGWGRALRALLIPSVPACAGMTQGKAE